VGLAIEQHPYRALYRTKLWRDTSRAVLDRDGGVCQVCGGRATQADHHPVAAIELWEQDRLGEFFDLANLRAICKPDNARLGMTATNARRRAGRPTVAQQVVAAASRVGDYGLAVPVAADSAPAVSADRLAARAAVIAEQRLAAAAAAQVPEDAEDHRRRAPAIY